MHISSGPSDLSDKDFGFDSFRPKEVILDKLDVFKVKSLPNSFEIDQKKEKKLKIQVPMKNKTIEVESIDFPKRQLGPVEA